MILWLREFVVVYGERICEKLINVEFLILIFSIFINLIEDRRMNYGL